MANFDEVKGRAKAAAGELTDNKRMRNEGKVDKTSGKLKQAIDKVAGKLRAKT